MRRGRRGRGRVADGVEDGVVLRRADARVVERDVDVSVGVERGLEEPVDILLLCDIAMHVGAIDLGRDARAVGVVEVTDDEKAIEHAMYTLANPCSANLVKRSKQWPGFSTLRMKYGDSRAIERPLVSTIRWMTVSVGVISGT